MGLRHFCFIILLAVVAVGFQNCAKNPGLTEFSDQASFGGDQGAQGEAGLSGGVPSEIDREIEEEMGFIVAVSFDQIEREEEALEASSQQAVTSQQTLVVNNTADSGEGSLRWALLEANQSEMPGTIVIAFELPEDDTVICPETTLPTILRPVLISGETQSGAENVPIVMLEGSCMEESGPGLWIESDFVKVRRLIIGGFPEYGIHVENSARFELSGSYIGTDARGTRKNGNALGGIHLLNSYVARIGGADLNVISGNGVARNGASGHGIRINCTVSRNCGFHRIEGNYIGTSRSGRARLENTGNGIFIRQAPGNKIGRPSKGNVISGNFFYGITVAGPLSGGHRIEANIIGLTAQGNRRLSNRTGINLHNSPNNIIGGRTQAHRNIISGNVRHGVNIDGAPPNARAVEPHFGNKGYSRNNRVIGNYIGTDIRGRRAIGNGNFGIWLFHTNRAVIGGVSSREGNLISGNGVSNPNGSFAGIGISSKYRPQDPRRYRLHNLQSRNILVQGNRIGTDYRGVSRIPNRGFGILVSSGRNIRIGSSQLKRQNVIKFNRKKQVLNIDSVVLPSNLSRANQID